MTAEPGPRPGAVPPPSRPVPPASERSIGELLTQLSMQTSRLVRDEMHLAQNEIRESVRHGVKGAGLISAAGVTALLGAMALVAAAIAALALALPIWAAALIVGVVLLIAAAVAAMVSRREAERVTPPAPRTTANVRRDIDEVKEASHARRIAR